MSTPPLLSLHSFSPSCPHFSSSSPSAHPRHLPSVPVTSSRPLPLIIAPLSLKQGVLARCVHREACGGFGGEEGINSAANKPPASCRGLGLFMRTEIEAGNLAVELDEVEWTASGGKIARHHRKVCVYRWSSLADVWAPAEPKRVNASTLTTDWNPDNGIVHRGAVFVLQMKWRFIILASRHWLNPLVDLKWCRC